MLNALTVDVEEYYHATEVQRVLSGWERERLPSRVEAQTERVLRLLDRRRISATFFIVGEVAERRPALVRRIAAAGHEIGCHSHAHRLVYEMEPADFEADTRSAIAAICSACGIRPRVYRAPSYSITRKALWAFEVLAACGFTHDSSVYPISHDWGGLPGFCRGARTLTTPAGTILEAPIATVKLSSGAVTPVGGGGYLRLLPYCYTAAGIRRINQRERAPACVYFHPWELDPEPVRLLRGIAALRTYTGLRGMKRKIERLTGDFEFSTLTAAFPLLERTAPCALSHN